MFFYAFLFCYDSGAIVVHDLLICVLRANFAIHGSHVFHDKDRFHLFESITGHVVKDVEDHII